MWILYSLHFVGELMEAPDRRKYPRLRQSFQVHLFRGGSGQTLEGTSVNVSQGGAFIKIKEWRSFRVSDQAILAFSLPAEYTGQSKNIRLQGGAVITRIDQKNKGIGVAFTRHFKQFEPVPLSDVVGQS
jgi:c-di-GMP-binding flagellar brake protein YcgR